MEGRLGTPAALARGAFRFSINPTSLDARAVADLREAVGCDRADEDYPYERCGFQTGLGGIIEQ